MKHLLSWTMINFSIRSTLAALLTTIGLTIKSPPFISMTSIRSLNSVAQ
ncbi:MAG: hypothetical protein LH631_08815 [Alkalinema sp. CAN_BIN05]|nr:hypothetical protein [Alkalinema sp. CAN_BIN05]